MTPIEAFQVASEAIDAELARLALSHLLLRARAVDVLATIALAHGADEARRMAADILAEQASIRLRDTDARLDREHVSMKKGNQHVR